MPISDLGLWGTNNMAGQDGPGGQAPPGAAGTQNAIAGSASGLSPLAQMVLQRSQNRQQNNPLLQANHQLQQVVPQIPQDMPPLQPPPAPGQKLQGQFAPVGQTPSSLPPTPPLSLAAAGGPQAQRQFDAEAPPEIIGNQGAPGGFDPSAQQTNQSFGGGIGAGLPNLPPNVLQQALAQGLGGGASGGAPGGAGNPPGGGDVRQGIIQGLLSNFGF